MDKGGKITLTLEDSNDLRIYLEEYLREFVSYKNYYLDEEAHKENFCDYIKRRFRDIVEHRKSFTYSFTPNKQYKMIEYIAYLMNHKILSITCDDDIFTFDLDGDDKISKVIQLKFVDEYDIQKFIAQGRKYQKGIFYTYENDNNVYFNRGEHRIPISSVDYILKFLRLCIIRNISEVKLHSYKELMNNPSISDKSVMNYYGKLNCDLKDLTLNKEHEFFYRIRPGVWGLNFDL